MRRNIFSLSELVFTSFILLKSLSQEFRHVSFRNILTRILFSWLNHAGGQENFNKSMCLCAGANNWVPTNQAINGGLMDKWAQIDDPQAWGYFKRQDIPWHYAVADAYTVGDAYHVCSQITGRLRNYLTYCRQEFLRIPIPTGGFGRSVLPLF